MTAIEKLKPYWRNPRKRSAASIRKIADSIATYGWQQPIVVDRDFTVIIGHGRLEAATLLKAKRVPVHVASNLTEAQARALRLADNRVNRESDWNLSELLAEIGDLEKMDFDLALAGFDGDDLKNLTAEMDGAAMQPEEQDGAPFTGDVERGQEQSAGEEEKEPSEMPASEDRDGGDQLVTASETMSIRQRNVVHAAIKKAKERQKLERRGDALFHICELYLEGLEERQ
jgi:ParB-like chromosome segregation protein Spo0J